MASLPARAELQQRTVDRDAIEHEGRVPAWIFNDAGLFEREERTVFARSWSFIGHASELRAPGDYLLRYIGRDAFIFVRDEHGDIRVIFDACRHRGTRLCRAEKGNTSHFRCPYHGWTYRNTGELIGVPLARQAYKALDKGRWSLVPAARVDEYRGFVFATLDRGAPDLIDYLGPLTWYLDIFFGFDSGGVEVLGEPHRWVVDCNWKLPADNFSGDDYHTLSLHKSIWEIDGLRRVGTQGHMNGYHIDVGRGHSTTLAMPGLDADPGGLEYLGYPADVIASFDFQGLSGAQRAIARRVRTMAGTAFPNFSFLSTALTLDPAQHPVPLMTVRIWRPLGPTRTEVWSWLLSFARAPEAMRRRSYEVGMGTFSAAGIFEQDDSEPWQTITQTSGSVTAQLHGLEFNYSMGLPGMGIAAPVADWPGPGTAYSPRLDESGQRAFYLHWHDNVFGPDAD